MQRKQKNLLIITLTFLLGISVSCSSRQSAGPQDSSTGSTTDAIDSADSATSVSTDSVQINPSVKKDSVR